ncbi:FAD-dependent oxidoreductase [Actinoplanes sp. NPDC048967]|uniref:FAD-dependent oxidoreductase n=1 Tax=Actinoplanes sp. NPDC048967 TaxID=3155269 RepID=UPI0033D7F20B
MLSRRSLLRAGGGVALAATVTGTASPALAGLTQDTKLFGKSVSGKVVLPGSAEYDVAKQLHYAQFDSINPQAIVYAEDAADVRTAVLAAQDLGIPLRVRSGGHNFEGWSTGTGIVLDVSRIKQVSVSGDTVHLGPGAQSIDALTVLSSQGVQIVAGTCPTVCPGGFLSGGGLGMQTRKFGIGSDRLVSARIVLADGRIVTTSATQEPDLFWALRGGGGGNFGVVVDFEVRRIDAPRATYYETAWAWDDAQDLLGAWTAWTRGASHNLGGGLVLVLPDGAPAPLVFAYGLYHGPKSELDASLDALVTAAGVQPLSRVSEDLSFVDAMKRIYACDKLSFEGCHREGTIPGAALHRGTFQRDTYRFASSFSTASLADIGTAFAADRYPGQSRVVQFSAVGGVANQPRRSDTAFVHRNANHIVGFVSSYASPTPTEAEKSAATTWTRRGAAALAPASVGAYVNFPGYELPDWRTAYYGENYARLVSVKQRYDRNNFFRHPRSIGS